MSEENTESKTNYEKPRYSKDQLDLLVKNIVGLVETYAKIIQLELKRNLSDALAVLIIVAFLIAIGSFALLFLSIGIAYIINYFTEWPVFSGFLIVFVIYVALLVILVKSKAKIRSKIQGAIDNLSQK